MFPVSVVNAAVVLGSLAPVGAAIQPADRPVPVPSQSLYLADVIIPDVLTSPPATAASPVLPRPIGRDDVVIPDASIRLSKRAKSPVRRSVNRGDVVIPDASIRVLGGADGKVFQPPRGTVVIDSPASSPAGSVVIATPSPNPVVAPPQIPTQEIRAAWITNVDSTVLFDAQSLREAMDDLQKFHFNTVYPVVWNWGYTLYPSEAAKRTIGVAVDPRERGLQGRDSLAEMVQQGRQHKIAVIPWFEFGFMAPADSELARRHPDWLTQRKDGSTVWQEGEYPRVWLNPFKPEVQDFILELIMEIVGKYGVDGIQFDDHMGLPSEFGYDAYTVALYKKENPGKEPPVNSKDPAWLRWRADKITEFMGRVFRTIKARKHAAIVSLSPNSQQFSYENSLQDWLTWQRLGYVEELVLQVYRTDPTSFEAELMQPEVQEAKLHIPVGIGILTGLKNKPVPISLIERKIQIARDRGFAGMSFFFYETMWNLSNESRNERRSSFQIMFEPLVSRPSVIDR